MRGAAVFNLAYRVIASEETISLRASQKICTYRIPAMYARGTYIKHKFIRVVCNL